MKLLFVHDHKFPHRNGVYYHSYGFDDEFFKRYLLVFNELEIVGRDVEISLEESKNIPRVNNEIKFYNVKSFSQLRDPKIKENIDNKIASCDFVIIRLPSVLGLYALKRTKRLKKPYLIEVVGSAWDSLWYQNLSKKAFAPIMSFLCKKAISKAPYVVYVTERYLQSIYPTNGQTISCSNVTLPKISNSLENRLEKIKTKDLQEKLVIGTCATLNIYKGQQTVIKAIAELKTQGYNIEYQLVGGGDQSYLKSLANEYGVTDSVKFLGKLKHNDVFLWMDEIDLYIQPSLTEGLPRAVIEAMSRGCPIIGSNAGGIPELIDESLVFKKGNVNCLCKTIKKLTPNLMIEQAVRNYENSKRFLKKELYSRRTEFLKKFVKESLD